MPFPSLRNKRVLVTGAGGFVGAAVANAAARHNAQVCAMISPSGNGSRLDKKSGIQTFKGDILDASLLKKKCGNFRPEVIYHFAAYGNQSEHYSGKSSQEAFAEMSRINIQGMANILAAADAVPFELFVNSGSAFGEYGTGNKKFIESQTPQPSTYYGTTKAAASFLAESYGRTAKRNIVTLRLTYVYGPGEGLDRFIPVAIQKCLKGQELPLTKLSEKKDFVYIDDTVDAFLKCAAKPLKGTNVINIGSSKEETLGDVLHIIEKISGKKMRYREGAYRSLQWPGQCWAADTRKAKKLLGWKPKDTLQTGIAKTFAWVKSLL